ncbi:uncharacterized protein [Antedon mediterranea]|uniref:uncharacterized protein n=1 Tax=Antedon mediterranea TaxID=105859 RepID=UPI003AF924D9
MEEFKNKSEEVKKVSKERYTERVGSYKALHVLTLSETKLCPNISNNELRIPNYNLIRKDRTKKGGGVSMYLHQSLDYSEVAPVHNNIECITVNIRTPSHKSVLLSSIYRPPNATAEFFNTLENNLNSWILVYPNIILLDLQKQPWLHLQNITDVNPALSTWTEIFSNVWNKHASFVTRRFKSALPKWLRNRHDIFEKFHERDHLKAKAMRTKAEGDFNKFRKMKNKVTKICREAKADYHLKHIQQHSGNPKKLWKGLKDILPSNKSTNISGNFIINSNNVSDTTLIANAFNNFFINVASGLGPDTNENIDPCVYTNQTNLRDFNFQEIKEEHVLSELSNIIPGKSAGPDGIDGRLLRLTAPVIARPLTYILNLSVTSSTFPSLWKISHVYLLFKSKNELSNYRPISVLPICSKILEKAIHSQLSSF